MSFQVTRGLGTSTGLIRFVAYINIYRLSLFEGRIYDDFCSGLAYGIHTGKPSCLVIVLE